MKNSFDQERWLVAARFAAEKHGDQKIPDSTAAYMLHCASVAMEVTAAWEEVPDFDINFALELALLHDVIEDTSTTQDEVTSIFGKAIGEGVTALSKNKNLPKELRTRDSLARIKLQPKEVSIVKLADRISNLQKPPDSWSFEKQVYYKEQAEEILLTLAGSNVVLEKRLREKIAAYNY